VNDCDLLTGFSDLYPPLSHLTLSMMAIHWNYRVMFDLGKLEWLDMGVNASGTLGGRDPCNPCGVDAYVAGLSWRRSHDDDRRRRLGTVHQRDRHTDSHVALQHVPTSHSSAQTVSFHHVRSSVEYKTPFHHGHHDPSCDTPVNSAVTAGNNSHPPLHLSHSSFHSRLKTHLFSNSFPA